MSKGFKGFEGFVKIYIPLIFFKPRDYFLVKWLQFFEEVQPSDDPSDGGDLIKSPSPSFPKLDLLDNLCCLVFVENDCRVGGDDISEMF